MSVALLGVGRGKRRGFTPNRNTDYLTLVGAMPLPGTMNYRRWRQRLVNARSRNADQIAANAIAGIGDGVVYVSSSSGSDSSGNVADPATPLRTLAAVASLGLGNGGAVVFKRGDVWRENPAPFTLPGITVACYGDPSLARPVWNAFTFQYAAGWTIDTGTTYARTAPANANWLKFADATLALTRPLAVAADLATCRATADSFVVASGSLYVNLGGQNPNTFSLELTTGLDNSGGAAVQVQMIGDGCVWQDVDLVGFGLPRVTSNQSYGLQMLTSDATHEQMVRRSSFIYTGYHSLGVIGSPVGGCVTVRDCVAGFCRRGPGGQTVWVSYADSGGQETIFDNITTIAGNLPETGVPRDPNTGVVYSHTAAFPAAFKLLIVNRSTVVPGPYGCTTASYLGAAPVTAGPEEVRGVIENETLDEGENRSVNCTLCPSDQFQIGCRYRGLLVDAAHGIGSGGTGYSDNCTYVGKYTGGYGSLFYAMGNGGRVRRSKFIYRGYGAMFVQNVDAVAWANFKAYNNVFSCENPDGLADQTVLNLSNASGNLKGNGYYGVNDPSVSASNTLLGGASGAGTGAIGDTNKTILTSRPLEGVRSGVPDVTTNQSLSPEYDNANQYRGLHSDIGPEASGAVSAPFSPATASKLSVRASPAGGVAPGEVVGNFRLATLDASGEFTQSYTGNATVTIGTNPGSGTLGGTTVRQVQAGVVTFDNLTIDKAGTGYTLSAKASSPLSGSAVSAAFNVASAWTPADFVGATLVFGINPTAESFKNTARTTPAGVGDVVQGITFPVGGNATQATPGICPVLQANGWQVRDNTAIMPMSVEATFPDTFTVYWVLDCGDDQLWPHYSVDLSSYMGVQDTTHGSTIQTNTTGTPFGPTHGAGMIIIRIVRLTGSTTHYVTLTGHAEVQGSPSGGNPYKIGKLWTGNVVPQNANSRIRFCLAVPADARGTADETRLFAWLTANSLPAF